MQLKKKEKKETEKAEKFAAKKNAEWERIEAKLRKKKVPEGEIEAQRSARLNFSEARKPAVEGQAKGAAVRRKDTATAREVTKATVEATTSGDETKKGPLAFLPNKLAPWRGRGDKKTEASTAMELKSDAKV